LATFFFVAFFAVFLATESSSKKPKT
jgi:hypothetical protein